MGLNTVWIRTLSDGLVRADQITGIACHRTPSLSGKPGRWLLTAALAQPASSAADGLHRTLVQTGHEPRQAPEVLAGLLARLATTTGGGIITPMVHDRDRGEVRFEFTPFDTGSRHGNGNGNGNGHRPTADLREVITVG